MFVDEGEGFETFVVVVVGGAGAGGGDPGGDFGEEFKGQGRQEVSVLLC